MEEVAGIKAKNITLEVPDPSKKYCNILENIANITPTNIATTPCPENIDSHKVVRSRFIYLI